MSFYCHEDKLNFIVFSLLTKLTRVLRCSALIALAEFLIAPLLKGRVLMTEKKIVDHLVFDKNKMLIQFGNQYRELNYNETLVLDLLTTNINSVIDKETLKEAGWPNTIVTDSSLQKTIQKLRLALAICESTELKTISGVGYTLSTQVPISYPKSDRGNSKLSTWIQNKKSYIIPFLAILSALLASISIFELTKMTKHTFNDYIAPGYQIYTIGKSSVLIQKNAAIPAPLLSLIEHKSCNCFYHLAEKEHVYSLSIYNKQSGRSQNYAVEKPFLGRLMKEIANE